MVSIVENCIVIFFLIYFKSGFVTDEEVKQRELKLRDALRDDTQFQVKEGASVEVAQVVDP